MWQQFYDNEAYIILLLKLKEREKKDAAKNENYEYKTYVERTQNDDDYNMHDINNKSVKSVSDDEIIKRKE